MNDGAGDGKSQSRLEVDGDGEVNGDGNGEGEDDGDGKNQSLFGEGDCESVSRDMIEKIVEMVGTFLEITELYRTFKSMS